MKSEKQEKAALARIQKIVAGLDERSYLKSAFDGLFKIVEQSLTFGWAVKALQNDSQQGREAALREITALKVRLVSAERLSQDSAATAKKWEAEAKSAKAQLEGLRATNKQMQQDILRLKARMFDMADKGWDAKS